MKFYSRQIELKALDAACSRKGAEMIVVSGRRRIGKSRLINEFLKRNINAAYNKLRKSLIPKRNYL